MVYIQNGNTVSQRSPWRLSILKDAFDEVLGFAILFFSTFLPDTDVNEAVEKHRKSTSLLRTYGSGGGSNNNSFNNGRPRGPTGSNIRGMGNLQNQTQPRAGGGG